ncbi:MAG: hypothetical protein M3450_04565 [Actinomycetota bacterium]|nr:hypothetical protein [Actinomycetota bacterium]
MDVKFLRRGLPTPDYSMQLMTALYGGSSSCPRTGTRAGVPTSPEQVAASCPPEGWPPTTKDAEDLGVNRNKAAVLRAAAVRAGVLGVQDGGRQGKSYHQGREGPPPGG